MVRAVGDGERLRDELRQIRDDLSASHATRLHRAVSWLRCADEYSETDEDMSFIALWIAFNSCYSISDDQPDHTFWNDFRVFTERLNSMDKEEKVYNCLWFNFSSSVRMLIDNKWVFGPFWHSQRIGSTDWERSFDSNKKQAYRALANNDVSLLLSIVMDRLYVLRNQVVHGGATWQSQVNRDQVRDGKRILFELIPIFIEIMMQSDEGWGDIHYPVVE